MLVYARILFNCFLFNPWPQLNAVGALIGDRCLNDLSSSQIPMVKCLPNYTSRVYNLIPNEVLLKVFATAVHLSRVLPFHGIPRT
jgi:hypothetical protein